MNHRGYEIMSRLRKKSIQSLWYFLILLLSACSTSPHLNIIYDADPVAILSPDDVKNDKTLNIHNQAIGEGAKTGAATGAVTGALYGLVCGPFFMFCSPFFAATGAVVGAGSGAIIGSAQGLESKKAEQANLYVSKYLQKHSPQDDLLAMVINRAQNHWQVIPAPAERQLVVQFDAAGLRTEKDGPVVLVLQATVNINYPDKAGKQQTRTQKFEYESSPTYIDSWTEGNEGFLQLRFNDAYQTLAENIIIAISAK